MVALQSGSHRNGIARFRFREQRSQFAQDNTSTVFAKTSLLSANVTNVDSPSQDTAQTYSAPPLSFSHACSGPTPG